MPGYGADSLDFPSNAQLYCYGSRYLVIGSSYGLPLKPLRTEAAAGALQKSREAVHCFLYQGL